MRRVPQNTISRDTRNCTGFAYPGIAAAYAASTAKRLSRVVTVTNRDATREITMKDGLQGIRLGGLGDADCSQLPNFSGFFARFPTPSNREFVLG